MSSFAEQDICASVEWQMEKNTNDKVHHLWKAVVGRTDATKNESSENATKIEMLENLERVFVTVFRQNYSFHSNSKNTTLYNNEFRLALEIQTPLNADDLVKIENLCKDKDVLPPESKIHSVDLELNLSSSTAFNISDQLPCLMSKQAAFYLSGLQLKITRINENGSGYFTIMGALGVNEKINNEDHPSTTNLVVLCDNRVEAGRKIISRDDGNHCRTTIDLPPRPFN